MLVFLTHLVLILTEHSLYRSRIERWASQKYRKTMENVYFFSGPGKKNVNRFSHMLSRICYLQLCKLLRFMRQLYKSESSKLEIPLVVQRGLLIVQPTLVAFLCCFFDRWVHRFHPSPLKLWLPLFNFIGEILLRFPKFVWWNSYTPSPSALEPYNFLTRKPLWKINAGKKLSGDRFTFVVLRGTLRESFTAN